jgi:ribosomal protein S18 acetylase RimI-like enzyme
VFVEPDYRGRGLGRAVTSAAIAHARTWPGIDFIDLGVSENAPEALRLYESLGFTRWGREPEATQHEGRRYDEIHMTLRLRSRAAPPR